MSELLKINVNDHTEKKGQLTYLSWAWAWAEILKIDPQATWVAHEFGPDGCQVPMMILPDTTAMVKVGVTISGHYKQCLLPVMDNKNKAIQGPDAFQVNTAIMRCLAKAIAMHGLGLYIYAGEDLPEIDPADQRERDTALRAEWLSAQFKLIDDAKTAGELKLVVSDALAVTTKEKDDDAAAQINSRAALKVAKAKTKETA